MQKHLELDKLKCQRSADIYSPLPMGITPKVGMTALPELGSCLGMPGGSEGLSNPEFDVPEPRKTPRLEDGPQHRPKTIAATQTRWAIRARSELASNLRDLALFDVAIDHKLRGCDLANLAVTDLVKQGRAREFVSVIRSKAKRSVQLDLTQNTRATVQNWVKSAQMLTSKFISPCRFHDHPQVGSAMGHLGVELEDAVSNGNPPDRVKGATSFNRSLCLNRQSRCVSCRSNPPETAGLPGCRCTSTGRSAERR